MTHPVFQLFPPWRGVPLPDCQVNFLGVQTSTSYFRNMSATPTVEVATEWPTSGEDIFEWVDLLETITSSDGVFTMVELGAGWGRWIANAAAACVHVDRPYRLVGVEAEPTHFRWMREHLERNGVDMNQVSLIEAVVAARDGRARFRVGAPERCYGQRIIRSWNERLDWRRNWGGQNIRVRALSLESVLREADLSGTIDLIDLDVQSAEADVLEPAARLLDERVRRVHVGTHAPRTNEERLRRLFTRLGWECLVDFPFAQTVETQFGRVAFEDGVQTWANPRP